MSAQETQAVDVRSYRMTNIDMMRGLVIVIMGLDHVRDYFQYAGLGVDIDNPAIGAGFYITRWITHLCAPVFVLLAGTSIGLMEQRRTKKELSTFLMKRGLWLIFVEIAIISTAFTFSWSEPVYDGATLAFLQVIWGLGVSMLILSLTIYLGARNCLILGATILIGQGFVLPYLLSGTMFSGDNPAWITLFTMGSLKVGPFYAVVGYTPLQWSSIMMIGYGSMSIFQMEPAERDALLRKIGISFIVGFFLIRGSDLFGDPNHWQMQELGMLSTVFDFFNVSKYPPSMLFFMITIGPMAILCSYTDKMHGWFKDTLVMFGRVPFAFYVGHFYLIHTLSVAFGVFQGFEVDQMRRMFIFYPEGYGTSLYGVYFVWILVMAIMYPFCKWVYKIKSTRKDWWLSYL
jgi:uncharacterized membrane protein